MIDRRQKSYFAPQDPQAVRIRFKKIAARATARIDEAVAAEPVKPVRRPSPLPLRVKRAS